jgi:gluconokinase
MNFCKQCPVPPGIFWVFWDSAIQMKLGTEILHLVIMGVAGCGKSSLGQRCATALGVPLLEGDDHHTESAVAKMRSGIALDDLDRQSWLDVLADQLKTHTNGAVLTCSALRQRYRNRLRVAVPNLRFVFLDLTLEQAQERVAARTSHLFPVSLVASQFDALEDPSQEPGVIRLDATRPLAELEALVVDWVRGAVALHQPEG